MILARRLLPDLSSAFALPSFAEALPAGRLVELSGGAASARTSLALSAVRQAQLEGEPVAWIQIAGGLLYPPDAAESGVDLGALVVVQVPGNSGEAGVFRAAEILLRSGAPGLEVLPMPPTRFVPEVPHARIRLEHVRVEPAALLEGDAYERTVKPFRTVEDIHVHAATLAYLLAEASLRGWPAAWR